MRPCVCVREGVLGYVFSNHPQVSKRVNEVVERHWRSELGVVQCVSYALVSCMRAPGWDRWSEPPGQSCSHLGSGPVDRLVPEPSLHPPTPQPNPAAFHEHKCISAGGLRCIMCAEQWRNIFGVTDGPLHTCVCVFVPFCHNILCLFIYFFGQIQQSGWLREPF